MSSILNDMYYNIYFERVESILRSHCSENVDLENCDDLDLIISPTEWEQIAAEISEDIGVEISTDEIYAHCETVKSIVELIVNKNDENLNNEYLSIVLDDGSEVECIVKCRFEMEGIGYAAIYQRGQDPAEDGVFICRVSDTVDGDMMLENIDDYFELEAAYLKYQEVSGESENLYD